VCEIILNILLDVISGILLLVIGWLSSKGYTYLRLTRPLSKVLGSLANVQKPALIIVPKLYSDNENVKLKRPSDRTEVIQWPLLLPLFAESDAKTMMYVHNLLLKCGKNAENFEVKSDVEVTGGERQEGLICIGAGSNSLSKQFLTTINPHLNFTFQVIQMGGNIVQVFGTSIVDRTTNETWTANATHDYGLIIRLKNPNNQEANIIILAGLGPAGTAAAGCYFSTHWKQIYDFLKSKKSTSQNYAVLVRTTVTDPTDVNLVKISSLQ
jgi:hypothetical protein